MRIPLAPAVAWRDLALAFTDLDHAPRFGLALGLADQIAIKLCSAIDWPLPSFFKGLDELVAEGRPLVLAMVAQSGLAATRDLAHEHGAGSRPKERQSSPNRATTKCRPTEYAWNHTTLHVLKRDKGVTYLQLLFPPDRLLETVAEFRARFTDTAWLHTEVGRFSGRVTISALPVIRWQGAAALAEMIAECEAMGILVAYPPVST